MKSSTKLGHLFAFFSIMVWGTTFISTKVLLTQFTPFEILLCRFVMGFAALFFADPHVIRGTDLKKELHFALSGLCGVTLYYFLENIALTYTFASNTSVIVSTAPFFTAVLMAICLGEKQGLRKRFFLGFLVAMTGIILISFNGTRFHIKPIGDLLALFAALAWGFYSVFTTKISDYGYSTIQCTRRIFMYGLIFMLPAQFFMGAPAHFAALKDPVMLFNMLFLGLIASAACFVTWNYALKTLGAVRSSVYIYLTPAVTVVMSFFILGEPITPMLGIGALLTLAGLVISES